MSSHEFNYGSGIQQDSLLGTKIHNLVVDIILEALESRGLGCHGNGIYWDTYVDDLLLSASLVKLQLMLNISSTAGDECNMDFTWNKTIYGIFCSTHELFLADLILYKN